MKIINPSVEIWEQPNGDNGLYDHIVRCTRVCYQTENKGESSKDFLERIIFKNKEVKEANHYSVLEHGSVYLKIDTEDNEAIFNNIISRLYVSPYTRRQLIDEGNETFWYFSTNLRVLVENDILGALKYSIPYNYKYHTHRVTVSFITDIGVSRELNRHRTHSISEESTRYCNYTKNRFRNEITFIKPTWITDEEVKEYKQNDVINLSNATGLYLEGIEDAEDSYITLINDGWKPQEAREILPLCTKTQVIHTAFMDDWEHFFKLRADGISGSVHPNMQVLAKELKRQFIEKGYINGNTN